LSGLVISCGGKHCRELGVLGCGTASADLDQSRRIRPAQVPDCLGLSEAPEVDRKTEFREALAIPPDRYG